LNETGVVLRSSPERTKLGHLPRKKEVVVRKRGTGEEMLTFVSNSEELQLIHGWSKYQKIGIEDWGKRFTNS